MNHSIEQNRLNRNLCRVAAYLNKSLEKDAPELARLSAQALKVKNQNFEEHQSDRYVYVGQEN